MIDGAYRGKLGDLVVAAADTVVWLDLPMRTWLPRLLRRTARRIVRREELWNGNRETLRGAIWGRDALIPFALRNFPRRRRLYPTELAAFPVVRLRSSREVQRWLSPDSNAGVESERSTRRSPMAFEELKQRQSTVWSSGPFEKVAASIADVHSAVVDSLHPKPGDEWLDAACGTGELSFLAAAAGAHVTGMDFADTLVDTARRQAAERGLHIHFDVGDVEALPYGDDQFDVVSSTFGVMFAPNHSAAASELARVVRPGGRLGLACWTPDGGVGDMFKLLGRFSHRHRKARAARSLGATRHMCASCSATRSISRSRSGRARTASPQGKRTGTTWRRASAR